MSKVRINDLARELEVKSRPILDALEAIGVSGKTHSSSIEADQAEKVREYFKNGGRSGSANRQQQADNRPKFNLSKVSKPGDALKAILERKQAEATAKAAPPPRPTAVVAPPPASATVAAAPPRVVSAPAPPPATPVSSAAQPQAASPAPRRIVPLPRQGANIVAPAPAPAIASKPLVGPVIARPPVASSSA